MDEVDKKVTGYLTRAYDIIYASNRSSEMDRVSVALEISKMIQLEEHKQNQPDWNQIIDKLNNTIDHLPIGALESLIMEMKNR